MLRDVRPIREWSGGVRGSMEERIIEGRRIGAAADQQPAVQPYRRDSQHDHWDRHSPPMQKRLMLDTRTSDAAVCRQVRTARSGEGSVRTWCCHLPTYPVR